MSGTTLTAATAAATAAPLTFNTKLLLHCDGTNGSTSFADASNYGRTVTAAGNAQVSTAQSKFGGASLLLDGTGDYLSVPDAANIELVGDYTIDFWVYPTAWPTSTCGVITKHDASFYGPYLFFLTPAGNLKFYASSAGSGWDIASAKSCGTLSLNAWAHIAVVRSGNTYYAFKGGTQTDTWTSSLTPVDNTAVVAVGSYTSTYSGLTGYMDEVRLSGVARWTSTFTPPTSAYVSD